jgi:TetR/AcrR family transcriptional repressor of nem operon
MARRIEFIPEEKVAKALEVFWRKGYTGASLADLIKAMKINKSSLYNSFGDKHTLFKETLKAYGKIVEDDYAKALKAGNSALENIDSIIDQIVDISIERENTCLGIKTCFELASQEKDIKELIKAGNDQTTRLIGALIREAQAAGEIKADRDPKAMAHFIFNSFSGLRQSFIIYGDKAIINTMGSELKAYLRN